MHAWVGQIVLKCNDFKNSSVLANDELSALPTLTEAMADLG